MRVLLVNPWQNVIGLSAEPIALMALGAFLEERGVECKIVNAVQHNIKRTIKSWKPEFVCVSATTPAVKSGYKLLDWCRERDIKTVIGGIHVSIFPEEAIAHSDWVVVGDGEYALWDIVRGKTPPGIIRAEPIRDISSLPVLSRHLVDIEYFKYLLGQRWAFGERRPMVSMMGSRGCYYRCTFCQNSKRPIPARYNSVENIVKEIEGIKREYKCNRIYFIDDDMFFPPQRAKELFKAMIPLNIEWTGASRSTSMTDELAELAYKSGCRWVNIGFESNSLNCLKALDKRTTPEDNQRAADVCKRHRINLIAGIMVGIPGETPEDLEQTIDFVKRNDFAFIGLCIATAMPGTIMWDRAREEGLLPTEIDWDKFIIGSPKNGWTVNSKMTYAETMKYFRILDDLGEKKRLRLRVGLLWMMLSRSPRQLIKTIWEYRDRLLRYIGRIRF